MGRLGSGNYRRAIIAKNEKTGGKSAGLEISSRISGTVLLFFLYWRRRRCEKIGTLGSPVARKIVVRQANRLDGARIKNLFRSSAVSGDSFGGDEDQEIGRFVINALGREETAK